MKYFYKFIEHAPFIDKPEKKLNLLRMRITVKQYNLIPWLDEVAQIIFGQNMRFICFG